MISDSFAQGYANHSADGIYYNGGSWMRIEICGYVTGKLHGWKRAPKAIANRLWAEINVAPEFPTSQEYLATDCGQPIFWLSSGICLELFHLAGAGTSGPKKSQHESHKSNYTISRPSHRIRFHLSLFISVLCNI